MRDTGRMSDTRTKNRKTKKSQQQAAVPSEKSRRLNILVANSKGGAGKTMTSMLLASYLSEQGHSVCVRDTDNGQSAYEWATRAADQGRPLPFPVMSLHDDELPDGCTVKITDSAPNNIISIIRYIQRHDFTVIPVNPGGMEVDRLMELLDRISDATDEDAKPQDKLPADVFSRIGLLLNGADATRATKNTREFLHSLQGEYGVRVLGEVPRRTELRDLFTFPAKPAQTALMADIAQELMK